LEAGESLCLGAAPAETLSATDYRDPQAAEYVGYQRQVPQTKTFGALQLALSLLCLELEALAPSGRGSPRESVLADLEALPERAADTLRAGGRAAAHLLERARPRCAVTFCGTGLGLPVARFASYKLLELACPAAFAETEEFCHTHYLVTGPGDAVVFLTHDAGSLERSREIVPVLADEIGAVPSILGRLAGDAATEEAMPATTVEVAPILLALAASALVRDLARGWGVDTGRFRAGVDEERYVRGSTRMIRHSAILDV
jgi:glucosamine 6-phosphate synthetase-like amidotransferase/phosphosugar isomerase protein